MIFTKGQDGHASFSRSPGVVACLPAFESVCLMAGECGSAFDGNRNSRKAPSACFTMGLAQYNVQWELSRPSPGVPDRQSEQETKHFTCRPHVGQLTELDGAASQLQECIIANIARPVLAAVVLPTSPLSAWMHSIKERWSSERGSKARRHCGKMRYFHEKYNLEASPAWSCGCVLAKKGRACSHYH